MMAEYLELAGDVIEKRESSGDATTLKLNELQCRRLWRHLEAIHIYFSWSRLYLQPTWIKYIPIFKEFYVIVTRADAIKCEFTSERSWLEAAVIQAHYKRAFRQLNLDLLFCVKLFYRFSNSVGDIPLSAASRTIADQFMEMDVDYVEDVISFRKILKDVASQPTLGKGESQLANYLVEREEISSEDMDVPQFCIAKEGYPTVGRPIGHGASGAVLAVEWLGMACAKKHFSATFHEECQQEASILARLNHPHVVKLLCVGAQPEVSFVMELLPMSLSEFIAQRWRTHARTPFTDLAALDMMLQIARGIEYLHDQGVAHRDLKSSNILVTPLRDAKLREEGYADAKVTDFGLAKMKAHGAMNPTRENMGTTRWRAPEAFGKEQLVDWKKADAYSFAMLCTEFLTGEVPFCDVTMGNLLAQIKRGRRPEIPSSCPPELASLLKDCWHTSPSSRPSFTEIIKALNEMKSCSSKRPPERRGLLGAGLKAFSGIWRFALS